MTEQERAKLSIEILTAKECMAGAGGAEGDKRLSPEAVRFYVSVLDDLTYADCSQALKNLSKKLKYFPAPAEVREEVKNILEERARANYKPPVIKPITEEEKARRLRIANKVLAKLQFIREHGYDGSMIELSDDEEDKDRDQ